MIERINVWGIPGSLKWLAYVIPMACALVLAIRLYVRMRLWWRVGRADRRFDRIWTRAGRVLKYVVGQVKVLRDPYPGLIHAAIAWGFFVFFLGTAVATIDADFFHFLKGPLYLIYKLPLDVFTVIALVGIVVAAYRRFVQRPERLTLSSSFAFSLVLVFLTVLTGLLTESLRLAAVEQDPSLQAGWHAGLGWWTPAGWIVAKGWLGTGLGVESLVNTHLALWLAHIAFVGLLFVVIPTGPLLHMITAPLNVFFSELERPRGRLAPVASNNGDAVGVGRLTDLTWQQLLQGDACTECGRCQDACPAHGAGLSLSPKRLILDIKDNLAVAGQAAGRNGNGVPEFVGQAVQDQVIWDCTTCCACVQECPVLIEHVDAIVDMRRYLLAQQRADNQLTTTLGHLRRYGNSFGKSDKQRAKWTRGAGLKIKDVRKAPAEVLWFAGDYASYSPTCINVTQVTARVFQRAGLDFGLLFDGERNAGNDIRRVGEEGLFELLRQKNATAMAGCDVKEIVTTDPHTYNALKNEYDWGEAHVEVRHHSEVLDEAIRDGRLTLRRSLSYTVTYHDPCYLGRYNDVYEAPRRVLAALGCRLVEMPRNRDRSLCCGAGGGRIWMDEEPVTERPSEARVREAAELRGVEVFVVTCPKDLTMYRDAVKTTGLEQRLVVKELAELVDEATREDAEHERAESATGTASRVGEPSAVDSAIGGA